MSREIKKESDLKDINDERTITLDQLREEINQYQEEAFVMEVPIGGENDGK